MSDFKPGERIVWTFYGIGVAMPYRAKSASGCRFAAIGFFNGWGRNTRTGVEKFERNVVPTIFI
jgi:hypothetical protein